MATTKQRKRRARTLVSGMSNAEVIEITQAALKPSAAAMYLDVSRSWLDTRRTLDRRLISMGLAPLGPVWRVRGQTIFYLKADLDAWLVRSSVERGHLTFRGTRGNGEHAK
jgi:hypothetical protein